MVVVESQPLYRVGLVAALRGREGLEVLAAEQVEDWHSGRIPVDVAVVGANPPECEDLEVVQQVSESSLHTRVLVLGTRDELTVTRALAAGAVGYLVKDSSGDTVCEAIEQIAGGESAFSPELLGMVARQLRAEFERPSELLSGRQREILELISSGLSAEEAGQELALSVSTVKTHLARVYEKLGVSGAPAAVREAMRRGLIA